LNFPLFIASRYFLSKRKKNFINIISILAMVGVAFSTAALIIVLSVFNGLEGLLQSINTTFDPELKIEAQKGKSFALTDELLSTINSVKGVQIVTEVIEDYAYVRYRDADMVVKMKGVSDNFLDQHRLDNHLEDGKLILRKDGVLYTIMGRGVRYALSVSMDESFQPLQIYYVKGGKTSSMDPSQLYARKSLQPGGVFSIEKTIDENYIFVPLDFAKDLLEYGNKRTAIEIQTLAGSDIGQVQRELKKVLGEGFKVLNNEEQHQAIYKLLKMEKLFTFITLSLLIVVASINIFFSLMMLALDKKKDISILSALGAHESVIRRIFFNEGVLIAFWGAAFGLLLGGTICWLQDTFGMVGMGMESALVSSYPVKMHINDFIITAVVIISVTTLISFYPARLASRTPTTQYL
jgi:lipoprotein-releasing system permease protein